MNVEDLLTQYARGNRKFLQVNLRGTQLFGADLAGANFSRANFSQANLMRANLTDVNLSKANLTHANLRGANLAGAILHHANLTGADVDLHPLDPTAYAGAILPDGTYFSYQPPAPAPLEESIESSKAAFSISPTSPSSTQTPIRSPGTFPQRTQRTSPEASAPQRMLRSRLPKSLPGSSQFVRRANQTASIPWLLLALWMIGYGFLSLFLYRLQAPAVAWGWLWFSALLGVWRGGIWLSLVIPVAVLAVLFGARDVGISLAIIAAINLGLILSFRLWQRWPWPQTLATALNISFLIGSLVTAIRLLGGHLVLSSVSGLAAQQWSLVLMMFLGLLCLSLGIRAWGSLQVLRSKAIASGILIVAAVIGMAMGRLMGWLALVSLG